MSDIIRLLPDAIANQIAAGEVIQRPASVVKELLENAIDARATRIQLLIKEAGKALIQVIDNGTGMSETDARMSFERHATSKISKSEDLQHIRTMGFRGEALASMAAVAQVDLKSRLHDRDLGTRIRITGSILEKQEPIQTTAGTSFSVSNLFYNVPARRKFLKSDAVELRNILEEFEHIALAYPEIEMSCHHNDHELYALSKGNLKQRIISLFNKNMGDKIVAVEEHTDLVNIAGFVGKVEACKKKRGEQYLFVNRRYIRSTYLHHAIRAAYESLISGDDHPFYVLFLDIDPARIDVNVHPSKHEIKFLDERIIYQYIRVATRHALGQYAPLALDFDAIDKGLNHTIGTSGYRNNAGPENSTTYQETQGYQKDFSSSPPSKDWRKLYEGIKPTGESAPTQAVLIGSQMNEIDSFSTLGISIQMSTKPGEPHADPKIPYQLHHAYILTPIASGFIVIDQEAAHQRILYDRCLKHMSDQAAPSQRSLFPTTVQVSGSDFAVLNQMIPDFKHLGFDMEPFGSNSFIVHGVPMDWKESNAVQNFIEALLRHYIEESDQKINTSQYIAKYVARYQSIKSGQKLSIEEMQYLIDELFACEDAAWGVFGGRCYINMGLEEVRKRMAI